MESMNENEYLESRVKDQLDYYSNAATSAKSRFTILQTSIIIGILVPVIVNLPDNWFGISGGMLIKIIVTILSLSLAIISGILNFKKYGDLWLSFRATEELLKHEKYLYLTQSGKYQEITYPFQLFVQETEGIISSEHNKFRSLIEDSKRPTNES